MAYKFQKGHADMSGSLTQLGAIIVSGTISASSGIDAGGSLSLDASAITSDGAGALTAVSFAGDGSGLTGISSDTVDTTTEAAAGTYYVPFVDQATGQDGETLRIAAALSLNPDTGAVSGSGQLQGGSIFIDSGAINSDGGGNLGVTSLGDGTATLQSGNLTGAGNVSGSGEIAGATAKFGGLNFEGNKVLTSNDGTIMFGATADQAIRANSLFLSSSVSAASVSATGVLSGSAVTATYMTASAHVSASYFFGNGAGLKGISSDTVDTTTEAAAGTYYVPFVDQATGQDGETLRIAAALSLNPDTGAVSGSGQLQGGSIFIDSGAINSDGGGNLGVTSLGDGTATLQSGNLTGAGNVSGSGEIAGATAKFGGLNFEGNKVLTSNDGTIMFGATADQALRANSLYLSSSADIKSTLAVALASTLSGIVTMGAVDNVIPATAAGIVASDHLYFDDGANVKKVTMGGIGGYLAGNGLVADGDGVISLTAYAAPATIADADATLVAGVNWGSTTFTSDHTWTLPSAPDVGDRVVVKAPESLGGFQVFIAPDGSQLIDGSATSLDLESDTAAVELIYVASNNWRVV